MWKDLSMKERASLIKLGVDNGIYNLNEIRDSYNQYAEGGPIKSYYDFATRLSKAWNNQDLSKDDYDYEKYYYDNPEEAYKQLEAIEHGSEGHFPDGGESGIYKTLNHPTYPDLGVKSWSDNDRVFHISDRQAYGDTDRILDYLGSDLNYNNGATRVVHDNAYILPSVTISSKGGGHTDLIPNELGTGWMYKDRVGRYKDFNYNYVNKYITGGPKRVLKNNSSTAATSTNLEDRVAAIIARDKNINHAYDIPWIKSKEMNINGRVISTNSLDSIAKYAGITNTPLDEAVALGFESNYGRQPYFNFGQKGVSDKAIGNMNYQKNYGTIPAHLYVRDYEYTKGGYNNGKPYTNQAPLEHAFNFYKSGRYNPGLRVKDKTTGKTIKHTQVVKNIAKELSKDPNYQRWKKTSGNNEYSGKAQRIRDEKRKHDIYKEEHPIKAFVKDLFGIKYGEGGHLFAEGGWYEPSEQIKTQITKWEGKSMYAPAPDTKKVNRPFSAETKDFNRALPKGAEEKLNQTQLDGLYSYSYNVGVGHFRKRVVPTLTKYLNGTATIKDVQKSMWATGDTNKKQSGLATRRAKEREMFGRYTPVYRTEISPRMGVPAKRLVINPLEKTPPLSIINRVPYGRPDVSLPLLNFDTQQPAYNDSYTGMKAIYDLLTSIKSPNRYNIKK